MLLVLGIKEFLYELADQLRYVFPVAVALEILLANPDLIKQNDFMNYLTTKADPMPEYMITILFAGSDQVTLRTLLENELQDRISLHQMELNELMRMKATQETYTLSEKLTDIAALYSLSAQYMLADYEASMGMGQQAIERCDALELKYDMGRSELIELAAMQEWIALKNELFDNNETMETLSPAQFSILEELAYSAEIGKARDYAQGVMNEYYEGDFYAEANTQFEELEPRSSKLVLELDQVYLEVYPSPAKDFVNIQLQLTKWYANTQLNVFASNGSLLHQEQLIDPKQLLFLNISDWANGNYHIQITQNEIQIDMVQFTISR